ncbi:MAG: peroxidase family protein, partial [Myxococcota bacterium]
MLGSSPARFHAAQAGKGRTLAKGLGAAHMGLIYVNPEGPDGNPDPKASAYDIRSTFGNMAMNDEETVALIAGGHTFGKAHGARPTDCVGVDPAAAAIAAQGFGWTNKCGKGMAEDTTTSGLEGAWTSAPVSWTHQYLGNLFNFEWALTKSPAGAQQWQPEGDVNVVPDAHVKGKLHEPMMLTTDLSMRMDPIYGKISKRFLDNPKEFEEAFANAWFKLTHRDLGPKSRYVGPEVPEKDYLWQDPVPAADYTLINERDAAKLKKAILASGVSVSDLVRTAWAAGSSYRDTDKRGGANGARLRLAPQKDWDANDPQVLSGVLDKLEAVRTEFNSSIGGKKQVSLADTIVLGGAAAIEKAAKDAGMTLEVAFAPGRTDASQEQTDVTSFGYLETKFDAFRNYYTKDERGRAPSQLLIEKADFLDLTIPEMTALIGEYYLRARIAAAVTAPGDRRSGGRGG